MSKFKVGDLVIGNKYNNYNYTNKVSVCRVLAIIDKHNMRVMIVKFDPKIKDEVLNEQAIFIVDIDMFNIYKDQKKQNKYEEKELVWDGKKEKVKFIINGTTTICILPDNIKGIAKCDPKDKFVKEYGYVLAYQRARYNQLYGNKK